MRSKRSADIVDQFIELRIALESLYFPGGRDGLRFQVSNHGAWHLGRDFSERRDFQKILRDTYDVASRAVHAGGADSLEKHRGLLPAAQDLCRRGILKRLGEDREPHWNELILGGTV